MKVNILNDPRVAHPEMKDAIDRVIQSISEIKIENYDVQVVFVEHNHVTVTIHPTGMTDEVQDLIRFLNRVSTGFVSRTGMSSQYFFEWFLVVLWERIQRAFPTEDYTNYPKRTLKFINRVFEQHGLDYVITKHERLFDDSGIQYYWINDKLNEEELRCQLESLP